MLLNVAVIYLSITAFLGTYGLFFAAFHPNPFLYEFSKYLATLFLLVYMLLSIAFMIRNKIKVMKAFRTEFKFYGFTFVGLPFLFVFFSYVHYMATLKGAPSIYTSIFGESYNRSVTITDKRLWGKRDRQEEIKLSGFDMGFPVSRRYYNSVEVGQEINVTAVESSMGIKIDFAMP